MKWTILCIMVIVGVFTHTAAVADPFYLIDQTYSHSGSLSHRDYDFSESFGSASPGPVENRIDFFDAHSFAGASIGEVAAGANLALPPNASEGVWTRGRATATAVITFAPTFAGSGPAIEFITTSGFDYFHHSFLEITVTDLTTSTQISSFHTSMFNLPPGYSLDYDFWDPNHEYQLVMLAKTMEIHYPGEHGFARITTNMKLLVPEPSSISLLAFGMIILCGVAARRRA